MDNVDASTNARRRVRESVCKLILIMHGGRERYLALSCRHFCRCLQLPMARLDTNHLQMTADVDGISGGSENVCVGTSLVCSLAGHDSHHREPISLLQLI